MKVTMIRHTSVDVPKGMCYGWSDVPVAPSFEQEATETKKNLNGKNFDCVFSSPLTRAKKLAAFCGYPDPVIDDRLKEMNMGDWEMRFYDDIEREDPAIRKWYEDYMFAHGGVLICAGVYAGLFPEDDCFRHLTPYGGIQEFELED